MKVEVDISEVTGMVALYCKLVSMEYETDKKVTRFNNIVEYLLHIKSCGGGNPLDNIEEAVSLIIVDDPNYTGKLFERNKWKWKEGKNE